jgi:hypothetical protein
MLQRLLDLPMPMVEVANGRPQSTRSVCSWPTSTSHPSGQPTATSRISRSHRAGDGLHVVWEEMLAFARLREPDAKQLPVRAEGPNRQAVAIGVEAGRV